jgi:hypothetical protein
MIPRISPNPEPFDGLVNDNTKRDREQGNGILKRFNSSIEKPFLDLAAIEVRFPFLVWIGTL